jgi:hypothetical protein
MPLPQLIVLGIVAMAGLATLRVVRVHRGRTPLPDGRGRRLFLFGFVVLPPLALGGIGAVPMYVLVITALVILMGIASLIIGLVTSSRSGQLLRLALTGREQHLGDVRFDPKVTAELAESVRIVDRANAVFPRGAAFPAQIARTGFRDDWDVLDGATRTLEGRIADDHRRGLAVGSAATATAHDARSRLDTLRRLARDQGQAWAVA